MCLNMEDEDERTECFEEFKDARAEGKEECRDQLEARRALCELLGEDRYDPSFDPDDFDDDFTNLTMPNPYFPLAIGNMWQYAGGDETNTVTVLPETKLIAGVTCIVVHGLVKLNGVDKEDTDDWYAHAKNGDVHYCGEGVKDSEVFAGDVPMDPELVSIEGSFKVGRDGDKSGIIAFKTPVVETTYRQEMSFGNAEDAATILSTTYGFGTVPDLDTHVPQALADHFCNDDCLCAALPIP